MSTVIREARSTDLDDIVRLFKETIESVNNRDYSPEQVKVWAAGSEKRDSWTNKISEQYFLVAHLEKRLAGFASITRNGYLDFIFVSRYYQRQGIAQKLYNLLERFAKENSLQIISSDVSITARPFFERQGFTTMLQQEVEVGGVLLTNYKMQKLLSPSQPV